MQQHSTKVGNLLLHADSSHLHYTTTSCISFLSYLIVCCVAPLVILLHMLLLFIFWLIRCTCILHWKHAKKQWKSATLSLDSRDILSSTSHCFIFIKSCVFFVFSTLTYMPHFCTIDLLQRDMPCNIS